METNGTNSHTLSVYVANKPGVLARIAQVFARRGFNIDSLVVSPSVDGHFSRMTLTTLGDRSGLDQIIKQVQKLVDVLQCIDHTDEDIVIKELALIKVVIGSDRTEALQIADHFGAKTVDLTEASIIFQITGGSDKLDAMIKLLKKFKVVELVRTGKVVMARGEKPT
ncbi:MAG: acetolactate synthase small subunit [Lentisphaerota bacterium]